MVISRDFKPDRIGLLGGTFNPVHRGHLEIARAARESFRLDEVVFIPVALPPHKRCPDLAPGSARARMLELALAGLGQYSIWRGELERGGVSYTIDTVRSLRRLLGKGAELFLIVGWDNLAEISAWKEISCLIRLCRFIGVTRPGCPARGKTPADERIIRRLLGEGRENLLELEVPVSSSEIRDRVRSGKPVGDLLPGRVEKYIRQKGLYGAPKEKS